MRKFFLFLFLISPLYAADTITTGSIGLIKPSITTPDSTRTAGDKLNGNFDMIAATITTVITKTNTLATDTGTLSNLTKTTSTWTASQTFTSSMTFSSPTISIGGNQLIFQSSPIASGDTVLHSDAIRAYWGGDGGGAVSGGVATITGSTQTIHLKVSSVYISTIDACGFPGACFTPGVSTWNVVAIWANAVKSSTVGWTRIDLAISTGGVNGLPLAPSRFNPLSLSTGSTSGLGGFTGIVSTGVPIWPGEYLGVNVSSMAASGIVTQGLDVAIDYFDRGRY